MLSSSWSSVLLGLLTLVACSDSSPTPRTQLMAVIDAEPELRAQIRRLHISVRGRSADQDKFGPASLDQEYALLEWPFRVGIVPEGGDTRRRVLVEATALGASGEELIVLRAITSFLDERTLALPLYFEALCLAHPCDPEQSCSRGSCVSAYQDPRSLAPLDKFKPHQANAGDASRADAEVGDAGSTALDAAEPLDADLAPLDAELADAGDAASDATSTPSEAGADAAVGLCGKPGAATSPGEDCQNVVFCGQAGPCNLATKLCCLDSVTANDMCGDLTSCGSFWRIDCDGPTDCPAGSMCCWEGFNSRCQTECEAGSVLCHETKDCPTGTCKPGTEGALNLFNWWGFCRQ